MAQRGFMQQDDYFSTMAGVSPDRCRPSQAVSMPVDERNHVN
jgi:hypothetical protein